MNLSKPLSSMTLQEMFKVVMDQYEEVIGKAKESSDPLFAQWKDLKTRMVKEIIANSGLDFTDEYESCLISDGTAALDGAGKWSRVFGIPVKIKGHGSVSSGVYVDFLVNSRAKKTYLSLVQSADELGDKTSAIKTKVDEIRKGLDTTGFSTSDVDTGKKSYSAGVIAHKEYDLATIPDDATLYSDLRAIVDLLKRYLASVGSAATAPTSYTHALLTSKNIIFRGAPGTGKSYLSKSIAAEIVSDGAETEYEKLTSAQQECIGFVQFHPSYDYSDFVEGLRPVAAVGSAIAFELRDGVFKEFVDKARASFEAAKPQKFVFIIDEINRGEISKILGELFFAIDPGYRGKSGSVMTQYANMHADPRERFYIPENVYIIGTMNDIDRSVDTFDFAMRRRFRFIEIKADGNERDSMLEDLKGIVDIDRVKNRMDNLNKAIGETDGLGANYHIGAAYFLKLKETPDFDLLWSDYLKPLLQEYVSGMYDEPSVMEEFEKAYNTED